MPFGIDTSKFKKIKNIFYGYRVKNRIKRFILRKESKSRIM